MHEYLTDKGFTTRVQILDNDFSEALKHHFLGQEMKFQIVPTNIHRTNAAEISISILKYHFIAGLEIVDPSFPMHLWCKLIPLATTTLNLLQPSHIHPKISATALLNGAFDCNKTPIALPCTKVIVHKNPDNQKRGHLMGFMVGILTEHLNITAAARYISQRRAARE